MTILFIENISKIITLVPGRQGRQIFCPIPFASFHPKIVQWIGKTVKKPAAAGSSARFDTGNRKHVAFFASDYTAARKMLAGHDLTTFKDYSLCDFFR
jgi:hypothetical protein